MSIESKVLNEYISLMEEHKYIVVKHSSIDEISTFSSNCPPSSFYEMVGMELITSMRTAIQQDNNISNRSALNSLFNRNNC